MIVVLDTNVFISALLSPGSPPARIIKHWEDREFEVAVSPPLLEELERALGYDRVSKYLQRSRVEIEDFLHQLREAALVVHPDLHLQVVTEDPDDNRVLECALSSDAEFIISGDNHLLSLGEFRGIQILPPAGFLVFLGETDDEN